MRKNRIYGAVIILFMLFISLSISPYAYASEKETGTINIDCRYSDMEWKLYRAGSAEADGSIDYDEKFTGYGLSEEPVSSGMLKEITDNLADYIKKDKTIPAQSGITDSTGQISFEAEEGWYIVIPSRLITADKKMYTSVPVMVCVSRLDIYSQMWGMNVTVFPKTDESQGEDTEIDIPVKDVIYNDKNFSENLPQTGQLWWPVPLLALLGMILFFFGYAMNKWRSDSEKNNIISSSMMILGAVMILSAVLLVVYNRHESLKASINSEQAVSDILVAENLWIAGEKAENNSNKYVIENGTEFVGILRIPKLKSVLPVCSEFTMKKLMDYPCVYFGNIYEKNMIIAAHNYESHFGSIKKLEPGDSVVLDHASGAEMIYEVFSVETVPGDRADKMLSGDWDLTLFTCDMGGKNRVTVRCSVLA